MLLKMTPIDRPRATYYWSDIATIDLAPFSSYLTLSYIVTFKSRLGVTQSHWKCHHWIHRIRVPIRLPL